MATSVSGRGADSLVGRDAELALIEAALDASSERGSALIFRGDPGIGKSILLDAAREQARARGLRVLATAGAEAESELPYSGLHRLLLPLLEGVDRLPAPQRSMLLAAFGIAENAGGDLFLVALGALGLLSAEASRQPVLVTIDDIHWLDKASRDVITFIGRRMDSDPIVLLGAVREGHERRIGDLGLPVHKIGPLTPMAARALLDARAPWLSVALQQRLLVAAAGNPLALAELPTTIEGADDGELLSLSARLEQAFAHRLRDARPETNALLLVFSADVTSPLAEILAAGEELVGAPLTVAALQPAFDQGLVRLDGPNLQFRHPLVRSAIYQSATIEQRAAAHTALARVLDGQPDRRAQHRAAAATGPDEDVARELEEMGDRVVRRGAVLEGSAALARAARLSIDPAARVRRLLLAAEPAFEAGRADLVRALVEQARRESLSEHDSARVEWLSEIFHDGAGPAQGASARVLQLVELGLRADAVGDGNLAIALLMAAALRCWWGGSGPDVRQRIVEAVNELRGSPAEARRVASIAMADFIGHAQEVVELIDEASALRPLDAGSAYFLAQAAHSVGAYDRSLPLCVTAGERLREQGRLALLAQTLVIRSVDSFVTGDFAVSSAAATEAAALAAETGQPIWRAGALGSRAAVAGVLGELEQAVSLADQAAATLELTGSNAVLAWLQTARGVIALSAGRYDEAYAELVRIFDPDDPAFHVHDQFMAVGHFVDAAIGRGGDLTQTRAILARLDHMAGSATVGLRMGLLYARPLLASDELAEAEFRTALAASWSARPFERARLQLGYGMWLRRQRRVVESRDPLQLARSGFEALLAPTWAERARQELRAAGEHGAPRQRQAWDELSPQELQIAQLAAAGLSNREIGQRLYLSHRTVASHLYRAYPKLGITSRSQLNAVLPAQAPNERRP